MSETKDRRSQTSADNLAKARAVRQSRAQELKAEIARIKEEQKEKLKALRASKRKPIKQVVEPIPEDEEEEVKLPDEPAKLVRTKRVTHKQVEEKEEDFEFDESSDQEESEDDESEDEGFIIKRVKNVKPPKKPVVEKVKPKKTKTLSEDDIDSIIEKRLAERLAKQEQESKVEQKPVKKETDQKQIHSAKIKSLLKF